MAELIKSKSRVRDHGEVFTPDFIVNDMLDLVKDDSENPASTFLEPACGNGNFLIEILRRKMETINRKFKKNQIEFECQSLVAIWSIYGVDLMQDNVKEAKLRLWNLVERYYWKAFKLKDFHADFVKWIRYILDRNIIQWDALSYKSEDWNPIVFSSWSACWWKISREDFSFQDLAENENSQNRQTSKNDRWEDIFDVKEIHKYSPVFYLDLYKQDDFKQDSVQSWCFRCTSKSEQWWSIHTTKNSKWNAWFTTKWNMVWLFN